MVVRLNACVARAFFYKVYVRFNRSQLKAATNEKTMLRKKISHHFLQSHFFFSETKNVSELFQKHFVSARNVTCPRIWKYKCFRNNVSSFLGVLLIRSSQ